MSDNEQDARSKAAASRDSRIHPEPPIETAGLRIGKPSTTAGGASALRHATQEALGEMGAKRGIKAWLTVNQKKGFDCPSCAWPDPDGARSKFEFCENGAKALAEEATTKRVTPEFFAQWTLEALSEKSDMWLGKQGRLTHPMIRLEGSDHYEPIGWEAAFARIAGTLNGLDSPNQAAFYTSGRTSNEAAFLYQLFVRQFGTNNLPDCSNMCHESSGRGLNETIGFGKSTVTLDDLEDADAIFVIGQNPGTNHPRMLTSLQAAARKGCKIVQINPLPEVGTTKFAHPQEPFGLLGQGTSLACLHLSVRINGDVALLKGMMKEMLEEEERRKGKIVDQPFIDKYTEGFSDFADDLRRTEWREIITNSGITREEIRKAAEIACRSNRTVVCWAMGLTQHKNGVANVQELVNFVLMRGNLGRPGAGLCCVRGHSNVQGDRTMGIWERMPQAFLDKLGAEFGFTAPREAGLDTVETIHAMESGAVKVFFGMGGNFLSAAPDTHRTAEALRRCKLTVQVSTKLNRGHLITGEEAIILPCLGRTEEDNQASGTQFVSVEDSMCKVHASAGVFPPASDQLLSEPAIVARLARAVLKSRTTVDWEGLAGNYDRIREHISHVIPGFSEYNRRIREPGGFYLPNPPRERKFPTASGKAHFTVHPIPHHDLPPGAYMMMTIRGHDQFNTTIYGQDDRYRGIYGGRRVVFLHADDVAAEGFKEGELVDLTSSFEGVERVAERFAVVPYRIPRRCAATYFPEANVLVPLGSVADKSNTPTSKSVVIRINRST